MYQVYTNRSVSSQKVQNSMPPKMVQANNVPQNVVPVSNIPLGAYNINFGYHSVLKDLFREDKLPTVKYGLYGDKLTKDNVSLEHLVPHSKNGKSKLFNFTLASKQKNSLRSNEDIRKFLTPEMAKEYKSQNEEPTVIKALYPFSSAGYERCPEECICRGGKTNERGSLSCVYIELGQSQCREYCDKKSRIGQIGGYRCKTSGQCELLEEAENHQCRCKAECNIIGKRIHFYAHRRAHLEQSRSHSVEEIEHSSQHYESKSPHKFSLDSHCAGYTAREEVAAGNGVRYMLFYRHLSIFYYVNQEQRIRASAMGNVTLAAALLLRIYLSLAITVSLPTVFCSRFTSTSASSGR